MPPRICIDRRALSWLILPLLLLCARAHADSAGDRNLATMLRSGGFVILMRHASSPATPPRAGQADPGNTRLERQLDAPGRSAARAMGDALRHLQIPIGEVLCSPTYRARETLRLAGWTQPQVAPELGDGGHSMQPDPTGRRGAWLRSRVAAQPRPGTDTLIVTQLPNIAEAFPEGAQGLADGGALVLRPDGHGGAALMGRIPINEWAALAATR